MSGFLCLVWSHELKRYGNYDTSDRVERFQLRMCSRVNTASRWSYCEMSPLSFSARALFSWHSLVFRLLCSSIWAWISLSVPWKWVVISFLFRSSSLHLCRVSSCIQGRVWTLQKHYVVYVTICRKHTDMWGFVNYNYRYLFSCFEHSVVGVAVEEVKSGDWT